MRRPLLCLAALIVCLSQATVPARADGFGFEMEAFGNSIATLVVCKDGRAITGTIESDGRVLCGPAPFVRTGRRRGVLDCGDGTSLEVSEIPRTTTLSWSFRGASGVLRRIR